MGKIYGPWFITKICAECGEVPTEESVTKGTCLYCGYTNDFKLFWDRIPSRCIFKPYKVLGFTVYKRLIAIETKP